MSKRELVILGCSSQQPTRLRNHGAYLVRWPFREGKSEGFLFDPGEGTQRQFIFAEIAPPCVTRIFISHFHGDHCLGVGSMLMRLNLDKVTHPIHCYYPASGQHYFDRLRYGTIYHENIKVVPHPISKEGVVEEGDQFRIEAFALDHGTDNFAWRITEADSRKYEAEKLKAFGIQGPLVKELERKKEVVVGGKRVTLDQVSQVRKGDIFSVVIDTLPCPGALEAAQGAKLFLCESTFLEEERELARKYHHMTAKQAAEIAQQAGAQKLVLTHFSARYQDLRGFEQEARAVFPRTEVADDFKRFEF